MGRKALSMSEKIRRYVEKNPDAKPQQIAAALGVKVALVYAVRYKKPSTPAPKLLPVNIDAVHEKISQPVQMIEPAADPVNHPAHYTDGGIETIDYLAAKLTRDEFVGYLKGNVLKYASRLGKKGEADMDAGKMAWYALKLREVLSLNA